MLKELEELKKSIDAIVKLAKNDVFNKEDLIKCLERISEQI